MHQTIGLTGNSLLYQGTEGSERVEFLCPARYRIGHFGHQTFQVITCTDTDNTKQTGENTPKKNKNIQYNTQETLN